MSNVAYTTYSSQVRGKLGGLSNIRRTDIGLTLRGTTVGCGPRMASIRTFRGGVRSLNCSIMSRGTRFRLLNVAYTTYSKEVRGKLGGLPNIGRTMIGLTLRANAIRCGPRRVSVRSVVGGIRGLKCRTGIGVSGSRSVRKCQRGRVRGRGNGFVFSLVLSVPLF